MESQAQSMTTSLSAASQHFFARGEETSSFLKTIRSQIICVLITENHLLNTLEKKSLSSERDRS